MCIKKYISCSRPSWLVKTWVFVSFFVSQISKCSISASFGPLASLEMYVKAETRKFSKTNFFLKLGNFTPKYGHSGHIYKYIHFLQNVGAHMVKWSCPTSKIFFSGNLRGYMLSICHSGFLMGVTIKLYFLSFLEPKSRFLPKWPKWAQKWQIAAKFQNALSQRVFIASRASKYMWKLKFESFRKF